LNHVAVADCSGEFGSCRSCSISTAVLDLVVVRVSVGPAVYVSSRSLFWWPSFDARRVVIAEGRAKRRKRRLGIRDLPGGAGPYALRATWLRYLFRVSRIVPHDLRSRAAEQPRLFAAARPTTMPSEIAGSYACVLNIGLVLFFRGVGVVDSWPYFFLVLIFWFFVLSG